MEVQETCIIDSCLPRTQFERCVKVFDYLVEVSEVGPHADLDPGHEWQRLFDRISYNDLIAADDERWNELEDEIIDAINEVIDPEGFVCTCGESQPGDVIVRFTTIEDERQGP